MVPSIREQVRSAVRFSTMSSCRLSHLVIPAHDYTTSHTPMVVAGDLAWLVNRSLSHISYLSKSQESRTVSYTLGTALRMSPAPAYTEFRAVWILYCQLS